MALEKQKQEADQVRELAPTPPPPSPNAAGKEHARSDDEESGPSKRRPMTPAEYWKPDEDMKLQGLVSLYGTGSWTLIAEIMGKGRTGKSCRLRWLNQLNPRINREAYTTEEEERLVKAQEEYGNKWTRIGKMFFPGRTDNSLKKHWHVMMKRMNKGELPDGSNTRLFPYGSRYRVRKDNVAGASGSNSASTIKPAVAITVGSYACNRNIGEREKAPYACDDRLVTLRTSAYYNSYEINGSKVPFYDFLGVGPV